MCENLNRSKVFDWSVCTGSEHLLNRWKIRLQPQVLKSTASKLMLDLAVSLGKWLMSSSLTEHLLFERSIQAMALARQRKASTLTERLIRKQSASKRTLAKNVYAHQWSCYQSNVATSNGVSRPSGKPVCMIQDTITSRSYWRNRMMCTEYWGVVKSQCTDMS